MFDPLDPRTWKDDPEDFVVPVHETGSVLEAAAADAEEAAQARAFRGEAEYEDGVQREALRQLRAEQGDRGFQQVRLGLRNLIDAMRNPEDPERERRELAALSQLIGALNQWAQELFDRLDRKEDSGV